MMIATTLIIMICIGGLLGLVGIGLLVFGYIQRRKGNATLNQQSRRNEQGYHDVTYAPVVDYTYEVNGQSYHSNTIASGWTVSYSLGMAQNKINQYQPGSQVTVHYNPNNPAEAVLETKSTSGNVFMIAGGVILAIALAISCCVLGSSLFTNGLMNSIMNGFK